ncbi:hypothetical protein RCL1_005377 [Eukaryota sp. TZLM3-RCL]
MKFIIDTDAGVDDAQAIISALVLNHSHSLIGITTVNGNCSVTNSTRNVLRVLSFCNRPEVPVFMGAHEPTILLSEMHHASYVHGKDGMGDVSWDDEFSSQFIDENLPKPQSESAAEFLVKSARQNAGELCIFAIGPLTNLLLAMKLDSNFAKNVKCLYIMGGSITGQGNVSKTAEFNAFSDPEAIHECVRNFPSVEIYTWELTLQHTVSWDYYKLLTSQNSKLSQFFSLISQKTVQFLNDAHSEVGWILPDGLCILGALFPELVEESYSTRVDVVLHGEDRGRTVAVESRIDNDISLMYRDDTAGASFTLDKNVRVVTKLDQQLLEKLLLDSLKVF